VVVPARVGVTFEGDQVESGFARAVIERGSARRLVVRGRAKQPEFTTAAARALHVSQRVTSFTASYPAARHLDVNLGVAARKVNGTLLRPGQTFSFNGVVGERTRAGGYLDDGAGGPVGAGVSRLASTVFNAMLQGGLAETGRTPATVRDARFPVGREVVIGWPADDLRFRNDTRDGVLVTAVVRRSAGGRPGSMTVELWSTRSTEVALRTGPRTDVVASRVRYVQRRGCRPVTGAAGFGIDVERLVRSLSGKVLHRDTFHTDYAATDTVRCRKPPKRRGR
jgi:vancomycin resistance protein YoaR